MADRSEEGAAPGGAEALAGGAAVTVVAFAAYARACAATPYLLDSAELAQAAFGLGIAHPPGEPLAALWGKLFCLLPIGSVAFRVALSQAVAAALAALLVYRLALLLFALLDPDGQGEVGARRVRVLVAAGTALGFALAPGVVIVADRPEVYALASALALAALLAALRARASGDPRWLLAAALAIALGVTNHPLVAGLTGVGAVLLALPFLSVVGGRARLVLWSLALFAAGLLVIAYLPARAAAIFARAGGTADVIAWGDARSAGGLWWVLSAETFARKSAVVHGSAAPFDLPFVLMEELEVVFAILALPGAFLLARARARRLPLAAVLAAWAGSVAAALVAGLDPANPDIRGYLGVALAATALLAGCAVMAAVAALGRRGGGQVDPRARWLRPALAALLVAGALTRWPAGDRYPGLRAARAADHAAGALLAELPPRAGLLTAYFETAFLVGYQRLVEGRRPDASWAHLGFVRGPGYADRIAAAAPALAPLVRAHQRGQLGLAAAAAVDDRHPLRFEPDEHLAPDLRARLVPGGATWALAAEGAPLPLLPAWALSEAAGDRQVRGFLAWRAYADATLACANRQLAFARRRLDDLRTLLPDDRRALDLRARCF